MTDLREEFLRSKQSIVERDARYYDTIRGDEEHIRNAMLNKEGSLQDNYKAILSDGVNGGVDFSKNDSELIRQIIEIKNSMKQGAPFRCGGVGDSQYDTLIPNVGVPAQFLQSMMRGTVFSITTVKMIDAMVGMTVQGVIGDKRIVLVTINMTGQALPYGDNTAPPVSNINVNFPTRQIIMFNAGYSMDIMENSTFSKADIPLIEAKRSSAMYMLEYIRNKVGFFGYGDGPVKVYGLLNDPFLLPYNVVSTGSSGSTLWQDKNMQEVLNDIAYAANGLLNQSGGNCNLNDSSVSSRATLAISMSVNSALSKYNENNSVTVRQKLNDQYPGMRILAVPELDGANGGENVFYLYVNKIFDAASTDDGSVMNQIVTRKLGSHPPLPGQQSRIDYGYYNAISGVIIKRPYGIYRATGI